MHGILLVDKPIGITSAAVVGGLKRHFGLKKVGHCGTLDPLASGLLPICINEGTKVSRFLLTADKAYSVELTLGLTTDSFDTTGNVLQERPVEISRADFEAALPEFRGSIEQLPPMFSALKHKGKSLYTYARKGIEIERQPRQVEIRKLDFVSWNPPLVTLDVDCSKGTYIRSLVHDIGQKLGCGATMSQLRRTRCGRFLIDNAIGYDALLQGAEMGLALIGISEALEEPEFRLTAEQSESIGHGRAILVSDSEALPNRTFKLLAETGRLIAIGKSEQLGDAVQIRVIRGLNLPQ